MTPISRYPQIAVFTEENCQYSQKEIKRKGKKTITAILCTEKPEYQHLRNICW